MPAAMSRPPLQRSVSSPTASRFSASLPLVSRGMTAVPPVVSLATGQPAPLVGLAPLRGAATPRSTIPPVVARTADNFAAPRAPTAASASFAADRGSSGSPSQPGPPFHLRTDWSEEGMPAKVVTINAADHVRSLLVSEVGPTSFEGSQSIMPVVSRAIDRATGMPSVAQESDSPFLPASHGFGPVETDPWARPSSRATPTGATLPLNAASRVDTPLSRTPTPTPASFPLARAATAPRRTQAGSVQRSVESHSIVAGRESSRPAPWMRGPADDPFASLPSFAPVTYEFAAPVDPFRSQSTAQSEPSLSPGSPAPAALVSRFVADGPSLSPLFSPPSDEGPALILPIGRSEPPASPGAAPSTLPPLLQRQIGQSPAANGASTPSSAFPVLAVSSPPQLLAMAPPQPSPELPLASPALALQRAMSETNAQPPSVVGYGGMPGASPDVMRASGAEGLGSITTISREPTVSQTSTPNIATPDSKQNDAEAIADDVWRIIRRRLQVERERERGFS